MPEGQGLPTFEELDAIFQVARDQRIPTYNWAPPEWGALEVRGKTRVFRDNCATPGPFDITNPETERWAKQVQAEAPKMLKNPKLASPFDDFTHVDPDVFSDQDIEALAASAGQTASAGQAAKANATVEKLQRLAGSKSPGMERLDTVFKWILATFHDLCFELNRVLANEDGQDQYDKLRTEYFSRLRDLDDHEPETKTKDFDGSKLPKIGRGQRGYGRVMKWLHVTPVIVGGRIVGLRVVVRWNPHSSSSGFPILHD